MKDFKQELKEAIKRKGIKKSHLAQMAGIRASTLYDFLNGHHAMQTNTLEKLFNTLATI